MYFVIVGWVPDNDLELLTQQLKQASKEILIEALPTNRRGHNANVPVALQDSKFLRPFQIAFGFAFIGLCPGMLRGGFIEICLQNGFIQAQ